MQYIIKDFRVNSLPPTGEPNSRYYVLNGQGTDIDEYVTDLNGNYHKVNPIGSGGTTVKVSSNDTTSGYLNGKLVVGNGISFTENNDGGNETLSIAVNSSYTDGLYWTLLGNIGTNPLINFIGTTDAADVMFRRNNTLSGMIGSSSTGFGYQSLLNLNISVGFSNSAFGQQAGANIFDGVQNSAFGRAAMGGGTPSTASYNSSFGYQSLWINEGSLNSAFGVNALHYNTTGSQNAAFGVNALLNNTTGFKMSAFGAGAFENNTTGQESVAIGQDSGLNNITGIYNNYIGVNAKGGVDGTGNNIMGYYAGASLVGSTQYNVFIGQFAGFHASQKVTPINTIAIGYSSYTTADNQIVLGNSNHTQTQLWGEILLNTPVVNDNSETNLLTWNSTSKNVEYRTVASVVSASSSLAWLLLGNAGTTPETHFLGTTDNQDVWFKRDGYISGLINNLNTSFGYQSLFSLTTGLATGTHNSTFGVRAGSGILTGVENSAFGYFAMGNTVGGNAQSRNSAFGYLALGANIGNLNSAFGHRALIVNTIGEQNAAFGANALFANTFGIKNSAFGAGAGESNTTGQENTFLGQDAGFTNQTGIYNVFIGVNAKSGSGGQENVIGGYYAGSSLGATNSKNVFLGKFAGFNASQKTDAANSIAIGADSFTTANNQAVFGNSSITQTKFWGALMPNSLPGTSGYVLISQGANVSPIWVHDLTLGRLDATEIYIQSDSGHLLVTDQAGTNVSLDVSPTDGGGVGIGTLNDPFYRLKVIGSFMFGNNTYPDGGLVSNYGDGVLYLGDGAVNVNGTVIIVNDTSQAIEMYASSMTIGTSSLELFGLPTNNTAPNVLVEDGGFIAYKAISTIGVQALGAIGSSPNANAATLSSNTLNLEPASASWGGVVTTGTQSFNGAKTFLLFDLTVNSATFGTGGNTSAVKIGVGAMSAGTRNNSTAVGASSLQANNSSLGGNSAFGTQSLFGVTSGYNNTGIGFGAGYGITTGHDNTAVGIGSMGTGFISVGTVGITGSFNTAVGYNTLYYNKTSSSNTAIGYNALSSPSLASVSGANTAIGQNSGAGITTGSYNVILGSNTGSSIATLNNYIILSDGQGNERMRFNDAAALSFDAGADYGAAGEVLTSNGNAAAPSWQAASGSSVTIGAATQIPFVNAGATDFDYSAGLTWGTSIGSTNTLITTGTTASISASPTHNFMFTGDAHAALSYFVYNHDNIGQYWDGYWSTGSVSAKSSSASGTFSISKVVDRFIISSGVGSAGASISMSDLWGWDTSGNVIMKAGKMAIGGTTTATAKLDILSTTEQLRIKYDASNYYSTTVDASGNTVFNAVGTSPEFTFSDAVNVPDDVYDATGWNGNTEIPTKNAIRDKIESLSSGIIVGTTTITSGTSTRVPFNKAGVYTEDAGLTYDDAANALSIGEKLYIGTSWFQSFGGLIRAGAEGVFQWYNPGLGNADHVWLKADASDGIQIYSTDMAINSYSGTGAIKLQTGAGAIMIGNGTAVAKTNILSTTEQLRLMYNASNYFSTTVDSSGNTTFNATGTSPEFTFSDAVNGPINAYNATTWNGSSKFATEDAIRDKIESLSSGITRVVVVTSGSATMGSTALTDYIYFVAGAHTMSLPAAAGNTNRYTVKNNHVASITVDTVGAENVEGAASITVLPTLAVDLVSDGTNWFII